jgi:GntR family transcriptional regulator/MocR family aminotransferase
MDDFWSSFALGLLAGTRPSERRAKLEDSLRRGIQASRLAAGTQLPSTRALAHDLGWSRGTVTAAYRQLLAEGYVETRQGAGTVVSASVTRPRPSAAARTEAAARYDLRPGQSDVSTFPVAEWLRAGRQALSSVEPEMFGYGDVCGHAALRDALADYLGRARGLLCTPDHIVITSGTTQSVSLVSRALNWTRADPIAIEDPSYWFHRRVVEHAGSAVTAVPVDDQGLVTAELGEDMSAVLVTPAHQYPTGVTLAPERRRGVVEWAQNQQALIIENDYDGELRYDRNPIGALQGMAPDHVAYLGSVSTTLAPGLRLGWIVAPGWLVAPLETEKLLTTHSTDVASQLTLAQLLTNHEYERHLRTMRGTYRTRHTELVEAVAAVEHPDVRVGGVSAGGQAPVWLPAEVSETDVVHAAAREGLAVEGISAGWINRDQALPGLVVGFARPPATAYSTALELLKRVLQATSC